MFIIGVLSWIIYGYKISSTPILIANLITLILNLLILISKVYYSKDFSKKYFIFIVLNYKEFTQILFIIKLNFC